MRTIIVDVTTVKRYSVEIGSKYQWAVDTGRFEGDEVAFAEHMANMDAPEATRLRSTSQTKLVKVLAANAAGDES